VKREFPCPKCGQTVRSAAAPGKATTCKACGEKVRVPLRSASAGRLVTCGECGAERETSAAPGKTTPCKECGAKIRVPLRDPDDAYGVLPDAAEEGDPEAPAPKRPRVRRTCPGCGLKVHAPDGVCPECAFDIEASHAGRPSGGGVPVLPLAGAGALLLIAAVWLAVGLANGQLYIWPLGLLAGAVLVGGLAFLSR
jgi:transcription elongation factor Elf1